VILQANYAVTLLVNSRGEVHCMLCSPIQETLRKLPLLMQMYTRHQWRNAKVESDGSGSKGRTPCTCLCYRCCALERGTYKDAHGALKGAKQPPRPCGPFLLKIVPR